MRISCTATIGALLRVAVAANAGRFEWKGGGNNWGETANGLFA
jgi:hypothetical protein